MNIRYSFSEVTHVKLKLFTFDAMVPSVGVSQPPLVCHGAYGLLRIMLVNYVKIQL